MTRNRILVGLLERQWSIDCDFRKTVRSKGLARLGASCCIIYLEDTSNSRTDLNAESRTIPSKKPRSGSANSDCESGSNLARLNGVFRVQRGCGHRDLPEAREEPLQEAVHAPRYHAEVQVSQDSGAAGYDGERVADKLIYLT